ncbi:MAG: GSCFA domain-containing protein [Prevotella sp.]|nr:GSCFA domain-containing protein [Prevotella sp.]
MEFRTKIDIERSASQIAPCARMLFVGSCFADSIGKRFEEERFPVTVNPFGTMYNPVSVWHTVEKVLANGDAGETPEWVFITLGTNHIYILKETGEVVDNCQKRPQRLFEERAMTVDECAQWLQRSVDALTARDAETHIVFTVSPIRYRKYGYHESQLSKATLLLAVDKVLEQNKQKGTLSYFPAYEIVNDELRDYRFYAEDMIHPSGQAVEYIWERLVDTYFSDDAKHYLEEWRPLKEALGHRPFNAESEEYRLFMQKTREKIAALSKKYPNFAELI